MDKYDSFMPNKRDFFHDDYTVSAEQEKFHIASAIEYGHPFGKARARIGIQKRMYKASGSGIAVDNETIGSSDS